MKVIEEYLDKVVGFRFLRKREKGEWREEMGADVHWWVDYVKGEGLCEVEGIERWIEEFGWMSEVWRRISKERYGFNMER
uniref:hypothetical protein n=1 Tax=Paenibacillus xylanexedens TaxID=528191 RepID=UPI00119D82F6